MWRDEYIRESCYQKSVVDLCCGTGWAGQLALHLGAKSVKWLDSRSERFLFDRNKFTQHDVHDRKFMHTYLEDVNVILYMGHFYHTDQQENILQMFTDCPAQDLILESKVLSCMIGKNTQPLEHLHVDDVSVNWMASGRENLTVRQPNLAKTILLLEQSGWQIKNHSVIDESYLTSPFYRDFKKSGPYYQFTVWASRDVV